MPVETEVEVVHCRRKGRRSNVPAKLSRHVMPSDMTLEEWQRALRRQ